LPREINDTYDSQTEENKNFYFTQLKEKWVPFYDVNSKLATQRINVKIATAEKLSVC